MRYTRLNWLAVSFAFGLFFCAAGRADGIGALEGGLGYFSGPSDFPTAYSGIGINVGFNYIFEDSPWAISVRYDSAGQGKLIPTTVRYFLGARPSYFNDKPEKYDVVIKPKFWSYYIEGGPAFYSASRNNAITGGSETDTGEGLLLAVGLEKPISLWNMTLGVRLNVFNSVTTSVSTYFLDLSVRLPWNM